MRILLTNDDGIRAPGIVALHDALVGRHPDFDGPIFGPDTLVLAVAPETVQSATGHGVTFDEPLMAKPVRVSEAMAGVAVDGRPADCVKLALSAIWPEQMQARAIADASQPDLVISGMNAGANVGVNVIYSGTVAAAIEGAFLGVPSIAVSLHLGHHQPEFQAAAGHARRAIEAVLAGGPLDRHECVNINIPRTESPGALEPVDRELSRLGPAGPDAGEPLPEDYDPWAMPPIRVCPMNVHGLIDQYERRVSPGGDVYYWSAGGGLEFRGTEKDSDVDLLFRRSITVTPLTYDLTRRGDLPRWRDRLGG